MIHVLKVKASFEEMSIDFCQAYAYNYFPIDKEK